jgi:hypothetical protein
VVHRLSHAPLATSAFYTVCGVQPGEACIIERTAEGHIKRPLINGVEAQSNHFVSKQLVHLNEELNAYADDPLIVGDSSLIRRAEMLQRLQPANVVNDLGNFLDILSASHINNSETVQRMVFCPGKGQLVVDWLQNRTNNDESWFRSKWPS